jgi:malate/lactate dehydrogenase
VNTIDALAGADAVVHTAAVGLDEGMRRSEAWAREAGLLRRAA